ncbi:MAG: glycine betaine ABC transporter substrate-binding protein, partial [Hyphomicrobiaceae bacterium]
GSAVVFEALVSGEVDAYVDYTGTIWTNQMKRTDVKPRADVLAGVEAWLEKTYNVKVLGALGFENAYSLAVSAKRAQQDGLKTIADLASVAPDMTIAGDYEFFGRPEWRSIRDTYGLRFRNQRLMQAEFMYQAAGAGEVDVISAYTSDGRIAKFDLKVLEDPRQAIPPYDAILLVSAKRSADKAFMAALAPLVGAIDVSVMREANARASDGASPAQAAAWLDGKIRR